MAAITLTPSTPREQQAAAGLSIVLGTEDVGPATEEQSGRSLLALSVLKAAEAVEEIEDGSHRERGDKSEDDSWPHRTLRRCLTDCA